MSVTPAKTCGVDPMLGKTNEDNDFRVRSCNQENIVVFLHDVTAISDIIFRKDAALPLAKNGCLLQV